MPPSADRCRLTSPCSVLSLTIVMLCQEAASREEKQQQQARNRPTQGVCTTHAHLTRSRCGRFPVGALRAVAALRPQWKNAGHVTGSIH